ncbi:helix-turn-helix transcriptional regulator [Bacillus haynesii]|uniref:helix-turn-helix transcriptional regulator n=1 Tax=Bacillus haynesii TaxID=1925021 RepID=UPI002282C123|nr:helix-turn-helix transcriptional regulator [Bacillus haynesii]MCY8005445.1 helix-turn-helix transcriptional regulator [Bacillus haynesii]
MMIKNRIKEMRIKNHVTQNQLAKDLNVTRQTIVAIENNYYNPSLELSLKLARYFKTSVEEIFSLDN